MKLVSGLAAAVLLLVLAGPVAASDPTPAPSAVPSPIPSECAVASDASITCPAEGGGTGGSSGSGGGTVDPGLSPEPVPSLLVEPVPVATEAVTVTAECPADASCAPVAPTCISNQDGTMTCTILEPALLPSCEPIAVDPNAPDASAALDGGITCLRTAEGGVMVGTAMTLNAADSIATTASGVAQDAMLEGSGESLGPITLALVVVGTLLGAAIGLIAGLRLKGSRAA